MEEYKDEKPIMSSDIVSYPLNLLNYMILSKILPDTRKCKRILIPGAIYNIKIEPSQTWNDSTIKEKNTYSKYYVNTSEPHYEDEKDESKFNIYSNNGCVILPKHNVRASYFFIRYYTFRKYTVHIESHNGDKHTLIIPELDRLRYILPNALVSNINSKIMFSFFDINGLVKSSKTEGIYMLNSNDLNIEKYEGKIQRNIIVLYFPLIIPYSISAQIHNLYFNL
jgi:hypothetical protein